MEDSQDEELTVEQMEDLQREKSLHKKYKVSVNKEMDSQNSDEEESSCSQNGSFKTNNSPS